MATFTDVSLQSQSGSHGHNDSGGDTSVNPEDQNNQNLLHAGGGEMKEMRGIIPPENSLGATATATDTTTSVGRHNNSNDDSYSVTMQPGPTSSDKSTTSYSVFGYYMKKGAKQFYSAAKGALDQAIEEIKCEVYNKELDGENILGAWLLMEVDHWDNETEKIVLLTEESLLTVRYDFVPKKVYKFKRKALKEFDTIEIGEFQYPKMSLLNLNSELKKRTCEGIRLKWNKGVEPGFIKNWTPTSTAMPWVTFTFHPLAFMEQGRENNHYDVTNFTQTVTDALNTAYTKHNPGRSLIIKQEPLTQNVYLGFPSQIHNQSFLGMSKDRGFLSF